MTFDMFLGKNVDFLEINQYNPVVRNKVHLPLLWQIQSTWTFSKGLWPEYMRCPAWALNIIKINRPATTTDNKPIFKDFWVKYEPDQIGLSHL